MSDSRMSAASSSGGHHYYHGGGYSTSETSPTDPDSEIWRSSPSTAFTSVHGESSSDKDDEEPFQSNATSPVGKIIVNNGLPQFRNDNYASNSSSKSSVPSSRTWRMPFTKLSAPPKASSSSAASASTSRGNNNTPASTSIRRKQSRTLLRGSTLPTVVTNDEETEGDQDDGSFVETTSSAAAHALAQYWNEVQAGNTGNGKGKARQEMNDDETANDYVVVARSENGKKVYRIRPRSRPSSAIPSQQKQTQHRQSKLQTPQAPSIRLTRSIPNLRTQSTINRDQDGFYRPTGSNGNALTPINSAFLALPLESAHHLLRSDDRTGTVHKSTLQSASSIPNLRAHRDHDVFGRLLGWSYGAPPHDSHAQYISVGRRSAESKRSASPSSHSAGPSPGQSQTTEPKWPEQETLGSGMRTPVDEIFPYGTARINLGASSSSGTDPRSVPVPHSGSQQALPLPRPVISNFPSTSSAVSSSSSPFGQGVKLPTSPRLKRKKNMRELHNLMVTTPADNNDSLSQAVSSSPIHDENMRSLREVASSETIRTVKVPIVATSSVTDEENADQQQRMDSPRTPLASFAKLDDWMLDTRIFDSLQCRPVEDVQASERKDSLQPGLDSVGRRHERGMSNTSVASLGGSSVRSLNSATSAGDQAHDITVTTVPGDDKRFVIWGNCLVKSPQKPAGKHTSATSSAFGVLGNRLDADSPGSMSSSNTNSHNGSKRSSHVKRHHLSDASSSASSSQLTPPSSVPSPSTKSSNNIPMQRVLLAATVDRWIADMTSRIELDLMTDFFLTYRAFLSALSLCRLLITRFEWALQPGLSAEDIAGRRIVRVRTYVVIRHWLLNYFHEDFVPDRELRLTLTAWLNRMGKDERLRANPTDLRLIKSLKKVVKRLKAAYSTIGVDEAADANMLIKTPLEAAEERRSHSSQGRLRSASTVSSSSLHSIHEESGELAAAPEMHAQATPDDSGTSAVDAAPTHLPRQDIRTSSSEDDVDLDIDIHAAGYDSDESPRIPSVIPISPPRARHYSPTHARKSRSPQLGSYERSPRALSGVSVIPDNHRISRAIASTVGSFSKLRRIMGTRQQRTHAYGEALDGPNDLIGEFGQMDQKRSSNLLARSTSVHPSQSYDQSGLGIYGLAAADMPRSAASSTPDLRHAASSGTMRRQFLRSNASTPRKTSATSLKKPVSPSPRAADSSADFSLDGLPSTSAALAPAAQIVGPSIQLDDYDSSGDESLANDPAPPIRTLRRLPAARDLRGGRVGFIPKLAQRHSIDSIASYATRRLPSCALEPIRVPSIAHYDSNTSSVHQDNIDACAGDGKVPFFVPLHDDSDEDDEPGDVEAALRRLEGQVDHEKQINKAKRVEKYLKLSEEAKANGGYLYEDANEASDEDDTTSTQDSLAGSLAFSVAPDQPETTQAATEPSYVADQPQQMVLESSNLQDPLPQDTTPATLLPGPSAALLAPETQSQESTGKRSLQRKSSMRRFFGSSVMSSTFWPVNINNNNSNQAIQDRVKRAQTPLYRSFILSYKIDTLAKHFCIIERDLLEKVTWQEMISGSWRERLDLDDFTDWDSFMKMRARLNADAQEQMTSPVIPLHKSKRVGDVQTIVHRFNLTCKWVASEIVLTTQTAERALLIAKIIKLAFKSYQMYNFQTVTQIIHALQLPAIERLKKTWSKIPSFEMRLFSQLKFFCSPLRDFRLLREAVSALSSQWGPPGQETREADFTLPGVPGALPFFGLILRDLAISSELPTFLDPSDPRAPALIDEETMLLPQYADPTEFSNYPPLPQGVPLRPLINIHKYRIVARTIQLVMTFKELAETYPYEPELPLYRKCLTLQCLPMQKITELSHACEK